MEPRRRVVGALAPLILLPAACAEVPRPILAGVQPVHTFELAARTPQPILRRLTPRRIAWIDCGIGPKRPRRRSPACASSVMNEPAVQAVARSAEPRVVPAVYVRPLAAGLLRASAAYVAPPPAPTPPSQPPEVLPRDRMDGAIKVFAYEPGRVYAVAAAPLRVTTLTLQPGETLVDKAAGDTVRWEIGETTSGSGVSVRTLVMLKPLTAGLATNMVLTTSQRVYLIDLSSTARHADRAIAWSYPGASPAAVIAKPEATLTVLAPPPAVSGTHYRIEPQGRRPSWTPQLVFDDGRRTFIAFGPELDRRPSPLLFVADGGAPPAVVNYRQEGGLYVVDRLLDRAELRLGGDRPEVVRIIRVGGRS